MKYLFTFLILLLLSAPNFAQDNAALNEVQTLVNRQQYQKALQLIVMQEETPEFSLEKALCYKALGDNKPAREILTKLTSDFPENTNYISELALLFQSEYNWESALTCFDRLIELDSTNVFYKIKKAEMLYKLDQNSNAAQLYKRLYYQYKIPSVLNPLGKSYEDMNELDSAQFYYKKAWNYDFYNTNALANYIKVCYRLKDLSAPLDAGKLYVAKDSTNKEINRLHASTYFLQNDYLNAICKYDECRKRGDSSLIVMRGLGLSFFAVKADSLAYENLKIAFLQDTTNLNVLFDLAISCEHLSKTDETIFYFQKFLTRILPEDETLYLSYEGLGDAYSQKEEYQKAIQQYEIAMRYATKNEKAITIASLADLYQYKLKDKKNALKYYKQYLPYLEEYVERQKASGKINSNEIGGAESRLKQLELYIQHVESKEKKKKDKN